VVVGSGWQHFESAAWEIPSSLCVRLQEAVVVRTLVKRFVRESASLLKPVMVIAVLIVTMLGLKL